jgi:type II secretory ATPase GspE/PulE/Tfp pilus assembly ATPase PilB-like protein
MSMFDSAAKRMTLKARNVTKASDSEQQSFFPHPSKLRKLAEILLEQGAITQSELDPVIARITSGDHSQANLEQALLNLALVNSEQLARAKAAQYGFDLADIALYGPEAQISPGILSCIPGNVARGYGLIPVRRTPNGKVLSIVASTWTRRSFEQCASYAAGFAMEIKPLVGVEEVVRSLIERYYPNEKENQKMSNPVPPKKTISSVPANVDQRSAPPARVPVDRRASDVLSAVENPEMTFRGQRTTGSQAAVEENVDISDYSVDQPVIIQMVNKLISDAISRRASDIHFEPVRDGLQIKYRIDGVLQEWDRVPRGFSNSCVSRIKVMAEMNIAERRVPQDGRITVRTGGRTVDMRVSSLPTQYGEAMVLRILDRSIMRLDIEHLGFGDRNLKTLNSIIKKPHGIFLATGPTGSGKTTTLYAALHAIQSPDINIITVEDPIEYELTGVRQSNTNEKAGLTFARQLRAILRQDPDVIYVGEIRDSETAEIAFRAALTGHLVFSTLHCNEAAAAVTRLLNMNVDPFLIASSVTGVLAQRLVRRICPACSRPYTPTVAEFGLLGLAPMSEEVKNANFRMGEGCPQCNNSGYIGRCSVQELMVMDDTVRALTLEQSPSTKIRQAASTTGTNPMITMKRDAAMKVMQGLTTCEEVQKRVMLDDD